MNEAPIILTKQEIQSIIEQAISKVIKIKKPIKKEYLSVKEFAEVFGLHRSSVHEFILKKQIEAIQLKGSSIWRIPISEIEIYKEKSRKQTKKDIFARKF
ncbi:MAG: helix-turn-helix domain-containing protein [Elusimicrobiota bacterium]|jgi:excisionase family DNA binding protein|nr:helix-turn-helix domain-containing protein [Elusimicrobiota bacterium]